MPIGTAKQFTAVLDSWVDQGIKEEPLGSNHTILGVEFGFDRVAWCCITQSLAQERVGLHCFHEAAVVNAVAKAKRGDNGMQWLPKNAVIEEGDLPCFEWPDGSHHISAIRDPGTQVKFQTNGGNEHDRMYRQWRDRKYVMGFIRLPFAKPGPTPPPADLEEENMKYLLTPDGNGIITFVYDDQKHTLKALSGKVLASPDEFYNLVKRGWLTPYNPKNEQEKIDGPTFAFLIRRDPA